MSLIKTRSFACSCLLVLCLLPIGLPACIDASENATACSKNISSLTALCPAGTSPKFSSAAHGNCSANGEYNPDEQSGEVAGTCVSDGTCEIDCVATGSTCPCGVASISREKIECRADCAPGCGDGLCGGIETSQSCPGDCAPPSGEGAGGSTGASTSGGNGGSSAKGGSGGTNGTTGGTENVAGSETAGTGGESVDGSAGGVPGAVKCGKIKTFGRYVLREDGALLQVIVDAYGKVTQTPVLEANTGKPLMRVVDVSDGNAVGCAVLDDGTVSCWQTVASSNGHGALGNGNTDTNAVLFRATEVLIAPGTPLSNVVDLAESSSDGEGATCAITDDSKLLCWGALDFIVNGGKGLNSPYAQAITLDGIEELTEVKQAAIAFGGACAVLGAASGNEVWCWGAGRYDQLPEAKDSQYPVKILGLSNPTKIAVDGTTVYNGVPIHTFCAIDDGNVRCWGANGHGEIGDDTNTNTTSPTLVKISSGSEISAVTDLIGGGSAGVTQGNGSYCGFRNGAVWCWGGGYAKHAANYGATNVAMIGDARGPTFLTSDGALHVGATTVMPNCGKL